MRICNAIRHLQRTGKDIDAVFLAVIYRTAHPGANSDAVGAAVVQRNRHGLRQRQRGLRRALLHGNAAQRFYSRHDAILHSRAEGHGPCLPTAAGYIDLQYGLIRFGFNRNIAAKRPALDGLVQGHGNYAGRLIGHISHRNHHVALGIFAEEHACRLVRGNACFRTASRREEVHRRNTQTVLTHGLDGFGVGDDFHITSRAVGGCLLAALAGQDDIRIVRICRIRAVIQIHRDEALCHVSVVNELLVIVHQRPFLRPGFAQAGDIRTAREYVADVRAIHIAFHMDVLYILMPAVKIVGTAVGAGLRHTVYSNTVAQVEICLVVLHNGFHGIAAGRGNAGTKQDRFVVKEEIGLVGSHAIVQLECCCTVNPVNPRAAISRAAGIRSRAAVVTTLVVAVHGRTGQALVIDCAPEMIRVFFLIGIVQIEHAVGGMPGVRALFVDYLKSLDISAVHGQSEAVILLALYHTRHVSEVVITGQRVCRLNRLVLQDFLAAQDVAQADIILQEELRNILIAENLVPVVLLHVVFHHRERLLLLLALQKGCHADDRPDHLPPADMVLSADSGNFPAADHIHHAAIDNDGEIALENRIKENPLCSVVVLEGILCPIQHIDDRRQRYQQRLAIPAGISKMVVLDKGTVGVITVARGDIFQFRFHIGCNLGKQCPVLHQDGVFRDYRAFPDFICASVLAAMRRIWGKELDRAGKFPHLFGRQLVVHQHQQIQVAQRRANLPIIPVAKRIGIAGLSARLCGICVVLIGVVHKVHRSQNGVQGPFIVIDPGALGQVAHRQTLQTVIGHGDLAGMRLGVAGSRSRLHGLFLEYHVILHKGIIELLVSRGCRCRVGQIAQRVIGVAVQRFEIRPDIRIIFIEIIAARNLVIPAPAEHVEFVHTDQHIDFSLKPLRVGDQAGRSQRADKTVHAFPALLVAVRAGPPRNRDGLGHIAGHCDLYACGKPQRVLPGTDRLTDAIQQAYRQDIAYSGIRLNSHRNRNRVLAVRVIQAAGAETPGNVLHTLLRRAVAAGIPIDFQLDRFSVFKCYSQPLGQGQLLKRRRKRGRNRLDALHGGQFLRGAVDHPDIIHINGANRIVGRRHADCTNCLRRLVVSESCVCNNFFAVHPNRIGVFRGIQADIHRIPLVEFHRIYALRRAC